MLTPSAPGEAPHGLGSTGDPQFNRAWQLLGGPQINVPVPRALRASRADLPLGVQVVGRPGDDARALRAAHWIEQQLNQASGVMQWVSCTTHPRALTPLHRSS